MKKTMLWVIALFLCAAGLAFLLTCCDNGDPSELDKPILKPTESLIEEMEPDTDILQEIEDKCETETREFNLSEYNIYMQEKPVETMWEFTHGVDRENEILLAQIRDNDLHPDCYIYMYRAQSNLSDAYNYYFRIVEETVAGPSSKFNYTIQVTPENIDEIWLGIEATMLMHNCAIEMANINPETYDVTTWVSVYGHIIMTLDEYQIRGFVVTENDVAAAMNENDWLTTFMDKKMAEAYPELHKNYKSDANE